MKDRGAARPLASSAPALRHIDVFVKTGNRDTCLSEMQGDVTAMAQPAEVVSVIRHQVRPGHRDAYEAWTEEVVPVAQRFDGHHGVAIIRPPDGGLTYTIVLHFDTLEHLRAWLESDVRQRLLARVEPHLAQPGEVEIRPGLDFWLSVPGTPARAPVPTIPGRAVGDLPSVPSSCRPCSVPCSH